jgi:hypothetical protein
MGASIWTGGLVLLVLSLLALWRAPVDGATRGKLAVEWVARFSGVAAASVGLLLASGLVLAALQVPDWSGLLLTPYGQVLLVKLLVVGAALGLGAYNALSAPRRAAHGGRAAGWVAAEAVAVAAVVLAAAVLTDLPPATAVTAAPEQSLVLAARSPGPEVTGRIQPARLGTNLFEVTLAEDGQPVRGAQVELAFEPVGGGALAARLPLTEAVEGDGRYAATGSGLTRAGPWQILVTIARPGQTVPAYTTFDLEIGVDGVVRAAGTPLPANVRALVWLNDYGQPLLGLLVLTLAAGWGWLVSRSIPGARRAGLLTLGLLLAALLWVLLLTYRT